LAQLRRVVVQDTPQALDEYRMVAGKVGQVLMG
jgi:hypothetical protein